MAGAMTKAPRGGKKGGKSPTARGKTGTKRRVRTEGQGVPLGLAVDGAKRNDCTRTRATSERIAVARPDATPAAPHGMGRDKGYDYDAVRERWAEFGCTAHIRARGAEAKALKEEAGCKARRGVVERTHSWMHRCRRVRMRWDKKARHSLGFLHGVGA